MMRKKKHEKIRDFFIKMGKQHRILLPVAVVGLAVTMLFINIGTYLHKGTKRIACAVFILCFFFIGNSFSYPYLNFGSFVTEEQTGEEVSAEESDLTLASEDKDASSRGNATPSEAEEIVAGTDFYSVEEILSEIGTEEDTDPDEEEKAEEEISEEEAETSFDSSDWRLILINKQHPIPDDYELHLGRLTNTMKCDERIIDDLVAMMRAAKADGADLRIASPYRNDDRQEYLFTRKIDGYMRSGSSYMEAYKLASQAVTVPGASEHQVGLAIDFNTETHIYLDEAFEDTKEGKWLHDHCAEYGFILRYPKNKEYITSIEYEPWHFRYVGKEAARVIMDGELCLEEFWDRYID